jgi:hypothetical protein
MIRPLIGNGDALLVNGRSSFNGRIHIATKEKGNSYPSNIVEMLSLTSRSLYRWEIFWSPVKAAVGPLAVEDEIQQGSHRHRVRKPSVILDNSGQEQKLYPVVLAGKALCKWMRDRGPYLPAT